jgi:hypothetical protein
LTEEEAKNKLKQRPKSQCKQTKFIRKENEAEEATSKI